MIQAITKQNDVLNISQTVKIFKIILSISCQSGCNLEIFLLLINLLIIS